MVGKNHLIAATSSLVTAWSIVEYCDLCINNDTIKNIIAPCASAVKEYMGATDWKIPSVLFVGLCLICYYVGTLLPDIDNENSMLGQFIHIPIQHRTWTHTMWIVIVFAIIGIWVRPFMWLACGYFVHLFWDAFSVCGVCWFYPFQKYISYGSGAMVKKGHFLKCYYAGKTSETVFTIITVVTGIAVIIFDVCFGVNPYGIMLLK